MFTFDGPVQSGSASVTSGVGTAGAPTANGNELVVNLSGVADQQLVRVTATGVTGTNGGVQSSTGVNINFLAGDTTGDRSVNSTDIGQTKAQSGNAATQSNFRLDVNVSGSVNSTDVGIVKSNSGHALP